MMSGKFQIDLLEVDGFRGHLGALQFPLGGKTTLLLGPQGTGKTSTLGAIEWCLFGTLAYFKSAESKTDAELVNALKVDETCHVRLRLRNDSEVVEVVRSKRARSRDTDLTVRLGNQAWTQGEAQQRIFTILGLSFDDFYRSVYLHQESIRGLITDDPRMRDEAIDRLLGLERARDLLGSIPMRDVKDAIADLTVKKEKLEERIAGATRKVQEDLQKALAQAAEDGLEDGEITPEYATTLVGELQRDSESLAAENGVDAPQFPSDRDLTALGKIASRAKSFFKACRSKVIEVTNVDALRKRRGALVDAMEELGRVEASSSKQASSRLEIEEKFGSTPEMESHVSKLNDDLGQLERRRSELDVMSRLADDALSIFETAAPAVCPVCEQPVDPNSVQRHLREVLEAGKKKQLDEITGKIKSTKKSLQELKDAAERVKELDAASKELSDERAAILNRAAEVVGQGFTAGREREEMGAEIKRLEAELDKAQRAYERREKSIEKAEALVDKLKAILNVLEKRQEFDALRGQFAGETEEIAGLKKRIAEVDDFRDRLERIVGALNAVQVELAKDSVERGRDEMERLYGELQAHPYYSSLKIDVSTKNVAGVQKNTYLIQAFNPRDAEETFVSGRFSTGQMNCAALAVFFALSRLSSHQLGFLILDDPSQNLDSPHKEALVAVLRKLAKEKQLLVATQDEELREHLTAAFQAGTDAFVAEFAAWSKKGPEVRFGS